jgi:hypothetical protein
MSKRHLILLWLTCFWKPAGADLKGTGYPGWVVEKNSTLRIEGSSNISDFTCDINQYLNRDTLIYTRDAKSRILLFQRSSLTIDVSQFDCHHKYITADLRKILRSEEHPNLKIHFVSMEDFEALHKTEQVKGVVDIELAGIRKRMEIIYTCIPKGERNMELNGSRNMYFSDFNLSPPRKLAGLIRINQQITVNFKLYFRKI